MKSWNQSSLVSCNRTFWLGQFDRKFWQQRHFDAIILSWPHKALFQNAVSICKRPVLWPNEMCRINILSPLQCDQYCPLGILQLRISMLSVFLFFSIYRIISTFAIVMKIKEWLKILGMIFSMFSHSIFWSGTIAIQVTPLITWNFLKLGISKKLQWG